MQAVKCYEKYTIAEKQHYKIQTQIFIVQSLPIQITTKCSTKKIIRIVNNILKLNQFQCALLCWLLKKTNCLDSINKISNQQISQIKIVDEEFQKKVLLFLLLNAYHVKNNFFSNGAQVDIDPALCENVKNFREVYKNWKPQKSIKNISLVDINKIFQSWNYSKNTKNKVDYNKIVDKILFLSKTYNVGNGQQQYSIKETNTQKNEKKTGKNNKKRKPNQELLEKQSEQEKQLNYHSPMKNSATNKIPWFQDDQGNNDLNPLRRSTRTMNRSIYDIKEDRYDINPNESLFRSFRSRQSAQDNMFNSLRNTNYNGNFLNANSFSMNQSIGIGNMFRSSLQDEIRVQLNKSKNSKKTQKNQLPSLRLKPTISFDQLK